MKKNAIAAGEQPARIMSTALFYFGANSVALTANLLLGAGVPRGCRLSPGCGGADAETKSCRAGHRQRA
jgi:hypothetical protein